jgi:hypothetical protein
LREEFNKNQELKDSVKKFREEAKKLEDSDALKEARSKYVIKLLTFITSCCQQLVMTLAPRKKLGLGIRYIPEPYT